MKTLLSLASLALAGLARAGEPIRLHPDNPHYFLWRGKPTVLITSGEHYGAVLNADFDYVAYLDTLAADGLNHTRVFSGVYREIPSSFGITDNTLAPRPERYVCPWPRANGADASKFDLTRWDDAYFVRLNDFMAQAAQRGIVVEMNLFCPLYNDDLWKVSPMNAANNVNGIGHCPRAEVYALKHKDLTAAQEAVARKLAQELRDFDNLYYEVCNEPYFGGVTTEWQNHIVAALVDEEKRFAFKHLISLNIANKTAKITNPNPAVSIFNFHYAYPPDAVAQNYHLNKLIGENETGFRGKADALYRTEAWDFILAGGGLYNNLDYSFTTQHPRGDFLDYKSPGGGSPALRRQLKLLKEFICGFEFVRMKPDNSVVKGGEVAASLAGSPASATITVRALAESGQQYALYLNGGTQTTLLLELPAGPYKADWLNTKTGQIDKTETLQHPGGQRRLPSPPYSEDIALRIKRAVGVGS